MKITISNINIINFKGIVNLSIDFDSLQTSIFAANEIGKTSIADAYNWLLTGKNSLDQKDFNIKNTVRTDLNRADHVVSANFITDNATLELKKVFREKWVKKRGDEKTEFQGHETLYYYNDVPLAQAEYQAKIKALLPDDILKLITNPLYFNSNNTTWGWKERRNTLLNLAGNITNEDVLSQIGTTKNRANYDGLIAELNSGKSVKEYKDQIAAKKKRINDDLKLIPSRIDENKRSMPEPVDTKAIEAEIAVKSAGIDEIEKAINDKNIHYQNEYQKIQAKQGTVHEAKTRLQAIRHDENLKISNQANSHQLKRNELLNKINSIQVDINSKNNLLNSQARVKEDLTAKTDALRAAFIKINATGLIFNEHEFSCPTCLREFEADDVEAKKQDMQSNFIQNKNQELARINSSGLALVEEVKKCDELISTIKAALQSIELNLTHAKTELQQWEEVNTAPSITINELLAGNQEYVQLNADIARIQSELVEIKPADTSELNQQKRAIEAEILALRNKLNTKDAIARCNERISQLEEEESTLAQSLADLEKTEFLIEDFTRSKMDILEARINGLFEHVTFKLFDRQINGGEAETCETMYKGVPFSDLNTAGRIWAGIDIINTLSRHYNVSAPIFLDNRESVSLIPETEAQIINLVVSSQDKSIRVVAGAEQMMSVA